MCLDLRSVVELEREFERPIYAEVNIKVLNGASATRS